MRAATEMAVPEHTWELRGVRLTVNNAAAAMVSPTKVAAGTHIRSRQRDRHRRAVTRSVTGIASWPASLVKMANCGPRPG